MPVHHSERDLVTGLRKLTRVARILIVLSLASIAEAQEPSTQQDYEIAQRKAVTALRRLDTGLITPQVFSDYNKNLKTYRTLLSNGTNGRTQRDLDVLRAGLMYRILVLSDVTIQGDAKTLEIAFTNVERDISGAGNLILNANDKKTFRELVYKEALPRIQKLVQDNFLARSMGLELLLEMEVVQPRGNARIEMFDQVHDVILSILKDKGQPDAVKIRAANSAKRYLIKANAIPQIQNALAEAMIAELTRPFVSVPFQNTILMALEHITSPRQLVAPRKPIVFDAAVSILSDQSQDLRIRCRAARVLGRAGYDAQIDFEPLAWKVAELTLETAARFSQASNRKDPMWDYCGWYLYTAFHHESRQETSGRPPADPKGFLNRAAKSELVRAAYTAAVGPAANMAFDDKPVDGRQLTTLAAWTDKNTPANMKYDPSSAPVRPVGATAAGSGP